MCFQRPHGATESQSCGRIYTIGVGRCEKLAFPSIPSLKLVVRLAGHSLFLTENSQADVPHHCVFLFALGF